MPYLRDVSPSEIDAWITREDPPPFPEEGGPSGPVPSDDDDDDGRWRRVEHIRCADCTDWASYTNGRDYLCEYHAEQYGIAPLPGEAPNKREAEIAAGIWGPETGARRRIAVYQYIADFWYENRHGPSIREIAEACGFASTSAASHHVAALAELGLIEAPANKARAIRILPRGEA